MNKAVSIPASDGWETVPQHNSGLIRGKIVKFRDGDFILDKQRTINGAKLAVTGVIVAWVKWSGGLPQEYRITQSGQRHPIRDELPDLDRELWEAGLSGERADPWHDTRYVYLIDQQTGEQITFITDSDGGRRAVGDLRDQIANVRTAHPDAVPVIELASGDKMPTRYGMKPKPLFKVIEWIAARRAEGPPLIEQRPSMDVPDDNPPRGRGDMDDDIPF